MIKNYKIFELVFSQKPDEDLYSTFKRLGHEPEKFGIFNQNKKYDLDFNVKLDDDTLLFILEYYYQFDKLSKEYSIKTMGVFFLALIAYLNNGYISRQKIYTFVNEFDTEEKIRKYTYNIYDYDVAYDDWHHVGCAFSQTNSVLFTKTENKEKNGVDGRIGYIYKAPPKLMNYVKTVIKNCLISNKIILNKEYNT